MSYGMKYRGYLIESTWSMPLNSKYNNFHKISKIEGENKFGKSRSRYRRNY